MLRAIALTQAIPCRGLMRLGLEGGWPLPSISGTGILKMLLVSHGLTWLPSVSVQEGICGTVASGGQWKSTGSCVCNPAPVQAETLTSPSSR
jgi:hypothetical protein